MHQIASASRSHLRILTAAALALATTTLAGPAARAAVIGNMVSVDFARNSTSFAFAPNASYTLSGTNGDPFSPVDIATSGTAQVNALGAPFFPEPRPTSYFPDRNTVTIGAGMLFAGFATPANIAFSLNDTFIGLAFEATDGTHYGYARFEGTTLTAYGYETVAGRSITAPSDFSAPIAVPEPASLALFGLGLAGLAVARRRRA